VAPVTAWGQMSMSVGLSTLYPGKVSVANHTKVLTVCESDWQLYPRLMRQHIVGKDRIAQLLRLLFPDDILNLQRNLEIYKGKKMSVSSFFLLQNIQNILTTLACLP
jgi:hypothetical protein